MFLTSEVPLYLSNSPTDVRVARVTRHPAPCTLHTTHYTLHPDVSASGWGIRVRGNITVQGVGCDM